MKRSFNGLLLALAYLVTAVTAASLLAWLLHGSLDFSYDRIFSRSVLLFAVLGLIPLWRANGLTAQGIGLLPVRWSDGFNAWPIGVVVVLPLILVFMVTGYRVLDDRVDYLGSDFLQATAVIFSSAILVALFEETLFRGVLFSALRRSMGFESTAVIVGTLYSLVHFLGAEPPPVERVFWNTGFVQVFDAFAALSAPAEYLDSFISLLLLGVMFCWVRERRGLWWCIGLHAAWVFAIRLFKEVTVRDVVNPYAGLVGGYDNFIGHLVSMWLLFIFVVLLLYRQTKVR